MGGCVCLCAGTDVGSMHSLQHLVCSCASLHLQVSRQGTASAVILSTNAMTFVDDLYFPDETG